MFILGRVLRTGDSFERKGRKGSAKDAKALEAKAASWTATEIMLG